MSKSVIKVVRPIGLGASILLALVSGAFLASLTFVAPPPVQAAVLQITTTSVDAGQIGIAYLYAFQANGDNTVNPSGATNWSIVAPEAAALDSYGLRMDSAGILQGIPNRALLNFPFTVYCDSNGASPAYRSFQLTIAGKLVFESGPQMPGDSTVLPGQANVPVFQFTAQALGEDIDLTSLTLFGLGTGSDTFDVASIKIWDDENSNGRVDGADQQIIPGGTFVTTEGLLSSKVTMTFGTNILRIDSDVNSGTRCLLVTYDFKVSVKPSRTFRLALEKPTDIGYKTVTTQKTYTGNLGGGNPYSQYNVMTLRWEPDTYFLKAYKSGIITIGGDTPGQATLYMSNVRDIVGPRQVRVGEETTALSLEFWTDSGHTILLKKIVITDSGTGDAATQIDKGMLYRDNDRNGVLSAGDAVLQEVTFAGDQLIFDGINTSFATPTASRTDPQALFYVVTYKFKTNMPITSPALTFQARIPAASDVTAKDGDIPALDALIAPDTPNLWGVPIAISLPIDTSVAGGTTDGPYPTRAVWFDIDTNQVASRGDTILITFDTNLASASADGGDFLLPVLGDYLGNNATFTFMGGNKLKITLGDFAKLTIPGVYVAGVNTENAASGINLKDTSSSIKSISDLTAGPAVAYVDIESGVVSYDGSSSSSSSSSSDSSSAAAAVGDKACIIQRAGLWSRLLPILRVAREYALTSPFGRLLTRIYYWI